MREQDARTSRRGSIATSVRGRGYPGRQRRGRSPRSTAAEGFSGQPHGCVDALFGGALVAGCLVLWPNDLPHGYPETCRPLRSSADLRASQAPCVVRSYSRAGMDGMVVAGIVMNAAQAVCHGARTGLSNPLPLHKSSDRLIGL